MVKRDWKTRRLVLAAGWLLMSAGALHATSSFSLVYAVQTPADGGVITVTELGSAYVSGSWRYPEPLPWTPPIGAPAGPPYGPYVNSYMDGDTFIVGHDPTGQVIYKAFVPGPAVDFARTLVAKGSFLYMAREEFDTDGSWGTVLELDAHVIRPPFFSSPVIYGHWATIRDLAVDSGGAAYVTGRTGDRTYSDSTNPNRTAAYVVKVDAAGSVHPLREIDGAGEEEGTAIAVDKLGFIYVAGTTSSPDFPATGGTATGPSFITKLDPTGAIVYATRLGAEWGNILRIASRDGGLDVVGGRGPTLLHLDASGALVDVNDLGGQGESLVGAVFGPGRSLDLAGSGHPGCPGGFVARVDLASEAWTSACLPGVRIRGLAVDGAGDAYVTGDIVSAGLFPADAARKSFVVRLTPSLPPDCTAAFASPATIWPPNGRLVPIAIRNVIDPEGDPVTITVTGVRQDEPLRGAANAFGIGTPGVSLRADRDGKGDGRVYHLSFTADDGNGGACTGTVTVCVPHDQGGNRACGDGGPLFDSSGH